jgi:cystathionine gamma-synthase
VLIARADNALWPRIKTVRALGGAVLGPFEAWLLLRGLRTLFLRVRTASASALRLAQHLHRHSAVVQVLYPGLPSHPQHALATRQFNGGFGGMLSVRIRGGETAAKAVITRLAVFKRATSLGSVESLVEHRASVEGPGTFCPDDLLRVSVGIEHVDDLIADFDQALAPLAGPAPA